MSVSLPFGVLRVKGLEFAVDARALEQVINWPTALQPHPSQGGALLGMFSLRGKALPLIDLRPLLGYCDAAEREPTEMVAIINHQNRRIGIAVSGVSDVMKLESRSLCHLEGLATAVALLPELALVAGERMIYLLDLDALFSAPQVLTARSRDTKQNALVNEQGHVLHHLLVLECNGRRYAVDARAITELVDKPEVAPNKFGIDYCVGVTNRRGVDVPVMNMDRVLGMEPPAVAGPLDQLLVLTSREGYRIGLGYDRMVSIVRKRASEILPLPTYGLRMPDLFAGVIGTENGDQALLLEHEALLERPETLNFGRIYQTQVPGNDSDSRKGTLNQTCLVFHAPVQFVVPLDQVSEILDKPERFVSFPQPESHLLGTFNLRGEQIPLVCLSSLVQGSPEPDKGGMRVLVVKGDVSNFGLVVTSTDSIETFTHPASEHPPGWESNMNHGASANGRVRSLVSIGKGDQNHWMTLIDLRNVVRAFERRAPSTGQVAGQPLLDMRR